MVQQTPRRRKNAGGFWMGIIVVGVYIAAIIAFAFQTWKLVDTIFPSDNLFMKVATVICLDVMSIIFAATEMFFPFWSKSAKHLALGMWLVTFVGALIASILYMYLSSIHLLHGVLDMSILAWAYAVIVLVMAADVLAITVGIRMEYGAHHPESEEFYSPAAVANIPQTQVEPVYSRADVEAITGELIAVYLQGAKNTSPLAQPQMQHSGNMKRTASAHRAAPGESTQTNK